jgi:regulator-associated protein of mTOR
MRDPTVDMEQRNTSPHQASSLQAEAPRRTQKSVRVAFGPDLETHIPPRQRSPAPISNHHRSFTTVEHHKPPPARPTSSSGENTTPTEGNSRFTSDQDSSSSARPTAALKRAKSDYGPRGGFDKPVVVDNEDEEDFAMRHGWQEEYTSSEYLKVLHSVSGFKCWRFLIPV